MSKTFIEQYYKEKHKIANISRQNSESVLRRAFARLLERFGEKKHLTLIEEFTHQTEKGTRIRFDGVVKNDMGLNFGYWEAKANVDLEEEIRKKFNKGYPKDNIIFEDGNTAVLYQNGIRTQEVSINEAELLQTLLDSFFSFETPELKQFNGAVEDFKKALPDIATKLREMIDEQNKRNPKFRQSRDNFWAICQESINPEIRQTDVDEMLIQHILTEQIFMSVFGDSQFIQENNIAKELYQVEATFFTGNIKRNTLDKIKNYYEVIAISARTLNSHNDKQFFLKKVYENFYKAYNPKGADKLGIVYTPSEIVQFQIQGTEYLLEKHFGKTLSDKGVDILDPATGTGTYICDLIEHLNPHQLAYKYKHEIHANEVSILPYYIANLNIEYTFKNKMGYYEEFPNICFVDTLDNIGGLGWKGKQFDMFGFSAENAERIKKQNERKISVIIGNPPYNARQANFNDDNKNKVYKEIDKRIKDTYIKEGSAQNQIVVYDMYVRFFRWALDRLNQDGIVSFITNSSYIDGRAFDGFRKSIEKECSYVYILDLGGDIRKLSGKDGIWLNEENTIFGMAAAVGISIMFLVKKSEVDTPCQIYYCHPCDIRATRKEKIDFIQTTPLSKVPFDRIAPDEKGNWINQTDNDFDTLMPLISKETKERIFELNSLGIASHRDSWVYDFSKENLQLKMHFFIDIYNKTLDNPNFEHKEKIAWDEDLRAYLKRKIYKELNNEYIVDSLYRPFTRKLFYYDKQFNGRTYQFINVFPLLQKYNNTLISVNRGGNNKDFHTLISNKVVDLHFTGDSQCLPLYTYDKNGNRQENITDWALGEFRRHYADVSITKEAIFYYVYAVLHTPQYRAKYEQNLKRDFPRIPYYADFQYFSERGEALADLHIGYESVTPYPLELVEKTSPKRDYLPKPKLKANKENGEIELDELTLLRGIPSAAWAYKLGNRTALEWILDQYKESKPSDKTIAEHFNTYQFSDYKATVIDLLSRVCRVSVETVRIVGELDAKM